MKKIRLDQLLLSRGFAPTVQKAQALILARAVRVNDTPVDKASALVPVDADIQIKGSENPYVSRGGLKLKGALDFFSLNVEGMAALDVWASTGGFTDCLLQHGASKVYAVDVGKAQLHPRLAADPRVVVFDGRNARHLQAGDLPETPTLAVTDVSFISLRLILPAINRLLAPGGETVALIKPQFEAGREEVRRGGVIRDPAIRQRVIERIREFGTQTLGWTWLDICQSPIQGPAGNVEFLSYWRKHP